MERTLTAMTVLILLVVLAAALVAAALMSPTACFERVIDDLDALRDARANPARWLR